MKNVKVPWRSQKVIEEIDLLSAKQKKIVARLAEKGPTKTEYFQSRILWDADKQKCPLRSLHERGIVQKATAGQCDVWVLGQRGEQIVAIALLRYLGWPKYREVMADYSPMFEAILDPFQRLSDTQG